MEIQHVIVNANGPDRSIGEPYEVAYDAIPALSEEADMIVFV